MSENKSRNAIQRIDRRELEEGDISTEDVVLVHPGTDPDDTYHDFREVNKLNVGLGVLTTQENAEAAEYEKCAECFGGEQD